MKWSKLFYYDYWQTTWIISWKTIFRNEFYYFCGNLWHFFILGDELRFKIHLINLLHLHSNSEGKRKEYESHVLCWLFILITTIFSRSMVRLSRIYPWSNIDRFCNGLSSSLMLERCKDPQNRWRKEERYCKLTIYSWIVFLFFCFAILFVAVHCVKQLVE